MEIIYKELLPRNGLSRKAIFEVDGKEVKIGISNTMVAIWKIQETEKIIALFLKQFGKLIIQLMLAEEKLRDYTFMSHDFIDVNGNKISKEDLQEHLENKILLTINKKKEVGFKTE